MRDISITVHKVKGRFKESAANCCKQNNIISDAKFGFQKGRSTVDAIFILLSLVHNYLFENKRRYVIFVDMMKCFDSI